MTGSPLTLPVDAVAIRKILPHRYPFLLVDRVIELVPNESITALKNLTQNEPFFAGHFPEYPVLPGVLQIEMIAQTGAIMLLTSVEEAAGKIAMLTGADEFKFRRPILPGDVATIHVTDFKVRRTFGKALGRVSVADEVCAEGMVSFALVATE
ncbi:MAG TPA: 3-hydroxyacyl-ACP dehydratase FabZ [Candidatus Sumerlaeota bacterium]|nr:3-hydroxyacyl-ACP dehydratase FabZ [Candidatus Sumerlaeota bacterium]HPK03307.1 3-hydroxyacyl-ACP dehydratase FabZ [Candidatus Sumerlaeota bacterium]